MDIKGLLIRLAVISLIFWLITLGYHQLKEDAGLTFIYFIIIGLVCGLLGAKYIVPWIGDAISTVVYSSGEEVRPDESMKAAAKLAQGDYEGAIAEHEKSLAENPKQSFAVAEIAKICNDRLGDPQRALGVLQQHLAATEWSEDDAAFLRFRVIDLHVDALKDYDGARDLLQQLIIDFPDTRHSANAHHKMNEVEQAQFKALQEQRKQQAGGGLA